jgi:hypothetical protein
MADDVFPSRADKSRSRLLEEEMFLSKAERDYLLSGDNSLQFSGGYICVIKSRLQKKIERFASEELPILIEKGLILSSMLRVNDVTEFRNRSVKKTVTPLRERADMTIPITIRKMARGVGLSHCLSPLLEGKQEQRAEFRTHVSFRTWD